MEIGDFCWIITCSIGALGVIFTRVSGDKNLKGVLMAKEFINRFKKIEYIKCIG